MKKFITTLLMLALVASFSMAQTTTQSKSINATTKDTSVISTTVTVSSTAVIHYFKAPVTPPVVTPPSNGLPAITIKNLVDGVMPDPIAQPLYTASGSINATGVNGKKWSNLIIDMKGSSTPPIRLTNCKNDTVVFCSLKNSTAPAIYASNCSGLVVMYDCFSNVSTGVYQEDCKNAGTMIIALNQFRNMIGPMPRGQFVQMNTTTNCTGCVIGWNRGENFAGASHPEDTYSLYMSSGTAATPIQVTTNWERGGGPGSTGSGGMAGDQGGSYQIFKYNIAVNTGNCGMAIAGGDHISLVNNQIYSAQSSISNVGLYVWAQDVPFVTNSTVSGNQVNWFSGKAGQIGLNAFWIADGEAIPAGWGTNNWKANINASILPANILTWQ